MTYGLLKLHEKLDGGESVTVTTLHPTDEIRYLFNLVENANLTRSHNYTIDEKLKNRTLCYSVTLLNDVPVLASLAWSRPMYNGIIRLCTRYCIDPSYSHKNFGKGTDGMRLDTMDHIIQQLDVCTKLGYTDFFIGREDKSAGRRSRKIAKVISSYTNIDWQVSNDKRLVCPNPNDTSCWQYVIYNNRENFNYEIE